MERGHRLNIVIDRHDMQILRGLVSRGEYYTMADVLMDGLRLVAKATKQKELPRQRPRPPLSERRKRRRLFEDPIE